MIIAAIILFYVLFITAIVIFCRAYAVPKIHGLHSDPGQTYWQDDDEDGPSFDTPDDDDFQAFHSHGPSDVDLHDSAFDEYPMGGFNPASGLPMLPYSSLDVAGNPFGMDSSRETSSCFDDFGSSSSFGCGPNDW